MHDGSPHYAAEPVLAAGRTIRSRAGLHFTFQPGSNKSTFNMPFHGMMRLQTLCSPAISRLILEVVLTGICLCLSLPMFCARCHACQAQSAFCPIHCRTKISEQRVRVKKDDQYIKLYIWKFLYIYLEFFIVIHLMLRILLRPYAYMCVNMTGKK